MITKDNMVYILKRTELKNITEHQLEEFISEFDLDDKGNVLIPYQHKGYTCNDIKTKNMILEQLQTNDQITSAKIQEMCGFIKQQARSVIDKMSSEEFIDLM